MYSSHTYLSRQHNVLEEISMIKEHHRTPLVNHWNRTVIEAIKKSCIDINELEQFNEHKVFISLFPLSVTRRRDYQQTIHLNADDVKLLNENYIALGQKMDDLNDHDNEEISANNRFWKTGGRTRSRCASNQTNTDHDLHKQQCDAEPTINQDDTNALHTIEDNTEHNAQQKQKHDVEIDNIEEPANDLNDYISENAEALPFQSELDEHVQCSTYIEDLSDEREPYELDEIEQLSSAHIVNSIKQEELKCEEDDDITIITCTSRLSASAQPWPLPIINENKAILKGCDEDNKVLEIISHGCIHRMNEKLHPCKQLDIKDYVNWLRNNQFNLSHFKKATGQKKDFAKTLCNDLSVAMPFGQMLYDDICIAARVSAFDRLEQLVSSAACIQRSLLKERARLEESVYRLQQTVDDLQESLSDQQKTVDGLKQTTISQKDMIQTQLEHMEKINSINNYYFMQCLAPWPPTPIVPHPIHQKVFPPLIATHFDSDQCEVTGYIAPIIQAQNDLNHCNIVQVQQGQWDDHNECKSLQIHSNKTHSNNDSSIVIITTHTSTAVDLNDEKHKPQSKNSKTKGKTCGSHRNIVPVHKQHNVINVSRYNRKQTRKSPSSSNGRDHRYCKFKENPTIIESTADSVHRNNIYTDRNTDITHKNEVIKVENNPQDDDEKQNNDSDEVIASKQRNDDKSRMCINPAAVIKHSKKVLFVLRGITGCCKMQWAQKLQRRNEDTTVFNDCRMLKCGVGVELTQFVKFKELLHTFDGKCIILVNDHPLIETYEVFIKYAVRHGHIFGRIIEFVHSDRLINVYQSRTNKDVSYEDYVLLMKIWQRDRRAELIYGCEEDKKYMIYDRQ